MTDRTCSVDGCERSAIKRGWCGMHYQRQKKRAGDLADPVVLARGCSIPGCEKKHVAGGFCGMHYKRCQMDGSPGEAAQRKAHRRPAATCSACDRPALTMGLCQRCYARNWRNGDPTMVRSDVGRPAIERFLKRVDVADSGCWEWQGRVNHSGYGLFAPGHDSVSSHRWSYEFFAGPIPDGLQIDHLCRVRHCCNPDHLEPVTAQENVRRSWAARRGATQCESASSPEEKTGV